MPEIGRSLLHYSITGKIGKGGMGEVYRAKDQVHGRDAAIKKVREQHSERFKQEARSVAALNHPYICTLFNIGPDYLPLEYVEGKPLLSPLPEREAVRLAIRYCAYSSAQEGHPAPRYYSIKHYGDR
jgi:serine/threonine protein kinase